MPTVTIPTIPVADVNDPEVLERQHGIDAYQALQGQLTAVQGVLATKQPDKVLIVGGDCAVSLAPFDYLSGRYGRDLGVVWLDTHPDISTTEESHHLHEIVVSSLLGKGAPGFNAHHPLASDQVILAGLIEEDLRPMDHNVFDYQVQRMTPKQLREAPNALSDWVRGHGFSLNLPGRTRDRPGGLPGRRGPINLARSGEPVDPARSKRRTGRLDGGRAHGLGRAQFTPVFKWVVLVGVKQQRPYH